MATPLRGEAMAPRDDFHPPGRRTVMTTPWFPSRLAPAGRLGLVPALQFRGRGLAATACGSNLRGGFQGGV
ncbi:hypothetical protein Mal4_12540 [Maioricimonas rarisocia]|uniref:Uncharacterized protein n=1 Tax=Maioricimonas rarisocia TaxID=2528026 RepID=A0A517Z3A6_9PLAN|nr:hypothetical protein Mal4_12540 [Maioricimonas rarisocia]